MDDRSKTEELLQRLRTSMLPERAEVARQLSDTGDHPEVIPALCHAAKHARDAELRAAAVQSLAKIGNPAAIRTLEVALFDSAASVRRQARDALKRLAPDGTDLITAQQEVPPGLPLLIRAAKSGDENALAQLHYRLECCLEAINPSSPFMQDFLLQHPLVGEFRPLLQFFRDEGDLRSLPHLRKVLAHPHTPEAV